MYCSTQCRVLLIFVMAVGLSIFIACTRRGDPQAALDHANQTLKHGDVASAEDEAKAGYERFHHLGPEWSWKFLLLQADALAWRGMNDRVLALLSSETTNPPFEELKLRKQRLEGLAYADLHRFPEAEETLENADRTCSVSSYLVCVDIALARGELEMERGRFGQGQLAFERALNLARLRRGGYIAEPQLGGTATGAF